jgi:chromosome segregation ATPase
MKLKIGIAILAVACLGLAIALMAIKKQGEDQHKTDSSTIVVFSNKWDEASRNVDELRQVNVVLTTNLATSEQQSSQLSNSLTETSSELASTKTSLQSAEDKVASLTSRLADLEAQNQTLDQRAAALTNTIASLDAQIADTQQKLSNSETNNAFLAKELEQQILQRAELERKFNDLNAVRAQVKKLRDEAFVARRLELMRVSATEQKGASLLNHPVPATNLATSGAAAKLPPHYDLNVEVGSDGSVRVIPPPTNSPAGNSP